MKELTIENVKTLLDKGEKVIVECFDECFITQHGYQYEAIRKEIISSSKITIKRIQPRHKGHYEGVLIELDDDKESFIRKDSFKYFRIKEQGSEVKEEKQTFKDLVELCRIAYYEDKVIGGIGTAKSFVDDEDEISVTAIDGSSLFTISNFSTQNEIEECISILKDQYPPKQTFDDLIDIAVQALKDGVIEKRILKLSIYQIGVNIDGRDYSWSKKNVSEGIKFFKSLYTETFVIENDIDILKLKGEPKITLSNSNEFVATDMKISSNSRGMHAICFIDIDSYEMVYSFFELKGATVTQKVGK